MLGKRRLVRVKTGRGGERRRREGSLEKEGEPE